MAAENKQEITPRVKPKKKSALTKLVERKKRQVGAADTDSEYGSRISLQGNSQDRRSEISNGLVPLEPEVIVGKKTSSGGACIPCKSASESQEKPRPKPRRHSRTTSAENVSSLSQSVKNSVKGAGDKQDTNDNQEDFEATNSGSVPSDATIYRFRNMRMAAEQPEGIGGRPQGPHVPKPPSTPRSLHTVLIKGEKRNHEPSSGEEAEVDSKRLTPNFDSDNGLKGRAKHQLDTIETHDTNHKQSQKFPPAKSSIDGLKADPANETITQLQSQYQQLMDADSINDSPLHLRRDSLGSQYKDSLSGSTPRSGRLAPLEVKSAPPPMEADVVSPALRTAYKADSNYRPASSNMLGQLTRRGMPDGTLMDQGNNTSRQARSDKMSLSSVSVMPTITTSEARSRNFLQGNISSSTVSVKGSDELERYFPDRHCHVFTGTWNMNELKSLSISLNDFILPETCPFVQDIYAIGTQENELNKKEWEIRLQETLGPSHVLYHSIAFGCLHLAIFVRRDLIWFCSAPEDDVVSLRAVAMVKTKGAMGIGFSMFGTSFLFINCHLTSDRSSSKNKSRLLDYHRVTQELRLPRLPPGKHIHPALKLPDVTARFDSVFWCGDLNFRLERRRNAVEGRVSEFNNSDAIPHFEELLNADQLMKYVTEGKIFEGFQEGRINFQPTFKFDANSDKYDSSSKMRIPSYTDRVLFRSRKKNQIACLHYDSVKDIKVSDHRPVFARFEVTLRPGRDNIAICAGVFDREVYVEANKRRAQAEVSTGHKNSSVCAVQ